MKAKRIITAVIAAVMLFSIVQLAPTAHAALPDPDPFELPIAGATGWMASTHVHYQNLYRVPQISGTAIKTLQPGDGFAILEEQGSWWKVKTSDGTVGWVQHIGCFINLPDVLPSIIYINTNAFSSAFKSSGYDIPNITGQKLYDSQSLNYRYGETEFAMPALYSSSKKLAQAQKAALADGNAIVLYEAFRPHSTQMSVGQNLRSLISSNQTVRQSINSNGWSEGWFIAQVLSSHQRGSAFDVSLAKITAKRTEDLSGYGYTRITGYGLYEMPTDMHELSPAAALHATPNGRSKLLTEGANLLQGYFTNNGFSNITSEWWHFNDKAGQNSADSVGILGGFAIGPAVYSTRPDGSRSDSHGGENGNGSGDRRTPSAPPRNPLIIRFRKGAPIPPESACITKNCTHHCAITYMEQIYEIDYYCSYLHHHNIIIRLYWPWRCARTQ